MNKLELFQKFIQLEVKYELLSRQVHDLEYWQYIRSSVWNALIQEVFDQRSGLDHIDRNPTNLGKIAGRIGYNLFDKNPFSAPSSELLVLGQPRRKKLKDGYWWDIYSDSFLSVLDLSYVLFERPYLTTHFRPPKTKESKLFYMDFLNFGPYLGHFFGPRTNLPDRTTTLLERVESTIEEEFGAALRIIPRVQKQLILHRTLRPHLRRLLQRISPELLMVVANNANLHAHLIASARKLDIPVVELQHGVIHQRHPAYHYPDCQSTPDAFPNYLFTFGPYWNQAARYPIPEDQVIPIGYPYLSRRKSIVSDVRSREQILFVGQRVVGKQLSDIAVRLQERLEVPVVYKLHPGEEQRYRKEYHNLKSSAVKTVTRNNSTSLYRLFAESSDVIGYSSTALFEASTFDLNLYLLNDSSKDIIQPLLDKEDVQLFDDAEDLAQKMNLSRRKGSSSERSPFFMENPISRLKTAINVLYRKHN